MANILGTNVIRRNRCVVNWRRFMLAVIAVTATAAIGTQLTAQTNVAVSLSPNANSTEKIAADELVTHLRTLYPESKFRICAPAAGDAVVYIGTIHELPESVASQLKADLTDEDSYAVSAIDGRRVTITGGSPRGTLFAVYALLEKLGFGFYLSYDTEPRQLHTPVAFSDWNMASSPTARERVIFNWHNFLSGCSAWNLADWEHWITQAERMRFNTVMVHAYGNNPMFSFTLNGQTKPTGYLSNTELGRDWGTEHVLDVRKIIGGNGEFDGPIFGADASKVSESERVAAAQSLMQQAFHYASERGMGIIFALDVDTETANPQNVIATLPASARFSAQELQLVNPDTPEGYAYYRAEIEQLMKLYPEITDVAVWFRGGLESPWRGLKSNQFPAAWQPEFSKLVDAEPQLKSDAEAPGIFAISKIAKAFRKALDESGHSSVKLSVGSWRFNFLQSANAFMPAGVTLLPLDYSYEFPSDPVQERLRVIGRQRPVVPIVWAQHDDRQFSGRSYVPNAGLSSLLRWSNSAGFGVIHWSTRPLDLFFKNVADQVWSSSENEMLSTTAAAMASRTFGKQAEELGGRYLVNWIYDSPAFGRETTDRFIDQDVDLKNELHGSNARLELLDKIRPLADGPKSLAWVDYFHDWELYAQDFFHAQDKLQESRSLLDAGRIGEARQAIAAASPEDAIAQYARTIRHGVTSPGEKGILISLNLRWLPLIEAQRQALGLKPLEVKFAPTHHEPLAQASGLYTFDFDVAHHIIEVLGSKELGLDVKEFTDRGRCAAGIDLNAPASLSITGLAGARIRPGTYQMKVEMPESAQVKVDVANKSQVVKGSSEIDIQPIDGAFRLTLSPVFGSVHICGMSLALK